MDNEQQTAPECIYLQGDGSDSDTTWSAERISEDDTKYVRVDFYSELYVKHDALQREVERLERRVKEREAIADTRQELLEHANQDRDDYRRRMLAAEDERDAERREVERLRDELQIMTASRDATLNVLDWRDRDLAHASKCATDAEAREGRLREAFDKLRGYNGSLHIELRGNIPVSMWDHYREIWNSQIVPLLNALDDEDEARAALTNEQPTED